MVIQDYTDDRKTVKPDAKFKKIFDILEEGVDDITRKKNQKRNREVKEKKGQLHAGKG